MGRIFDFQNISMHTKGMAKNMAKAMFHLVLPPRCLGCDDMVANQGGLCSACWAELPLIDGPVCQRTGSPLAFDLGEAITSAEAIADPPLYRKMRVASRYDGTAQKLILSLKFHDRLDLAKPLAGFMARAGAGLLEEADILIPVPLHRQRFISRRFNQADLLSREISDLSGVPCALQAIERIRPTRQQTSLQRDERHRNVEGAFKVPAEQAINVHGKRVVLIDDVVTTGATVSACVRALLREKAAHVDVLAFAKVVDADKNLI